MLLWSVSSTVPSALIAVTLTSSLSNLISDLFHVFFHHLSHVLQHGFIQLSSHGFHQHFISSHQCCFFLRLLSHWYLRSTTNSTRCFSGWNGIDPYKQRIKDSICFKVCGMNGDTKRCERSP
ncbi:hypothetical protein F2Q70_00011904 [Brassica cretica]|uniref:Uncharacterized protein n=1 Tax=Brassica cretica TaxID=69181 RepID=A0A8S9MAQ6_BRACR|nr:hypothetical protein F2Q70_00011904 [Brassica cretica]